MPLFQGRSILPQNPVKRIPEAQGPTMADAVTLTDQVESYHSWKKELVRNITRYRRWLQFNELLEEDIERHLQRSIRLLVEDELTIAFVGEYSRGKTELINALFLTGHGQRLLPSEAGRTTMCPTELFFDRHARTSYLMLLPIGTRNGPMSLQQLRHEPGAWETVALDPNDTAAMANTLARVAETRSVPRAEAADLGFNDAMLDASSDDPHQVLIPAWRHAMISLQHPVLERGLRILDTPGLNALGSEPELTVSMLPSAQAVVFLLAADAGVTASDMTIWREHIDTRDADHRAGRFAILNKIDVLWDDPSGNDHTGTAIKRVRETTARQLGLGMEDVLPVSAKQGLLGRIRDDDALRRKSGLAQLEELVSERILGRREQLISGELVSDLRSMIRDNQADLENQQASLDAELELLEAQGTDRQEISELAEKTRHDYDFFNRRLITLKSSRRLMASQGDILRRILNPERFEQHVERTRQRLEGSWTTPGLASAMNALFEVLENDFNNLMAEGRRAEKMVESIYRRHTNSGNERPLEPVPLRLGRHLIALRDLRSRADRFRRDPRSLLTQQNRLIQQFLATIVTEARQIIHRTMQDIDRWPGEALMPLLQHTQQQKQRLETQFRRLRHIVDDEKELKAEADKLRQQRGTLEQQLRVARKLEAGIAPPPGAQLP